MEYNTNRGDLEFREYGRIVQKLVDNVCAVEDSDKKNDAAKSLVYVMGQISGLSVKDDVSYHKLWNHLMILSDFRLEKSWPFSQEELNHLKERHGEEKEKPAKLPYKESNVDERQYGAYLSNMLDKLKDIPDGDEYNEIVKQVAQQAKRDYLVWNGDLSDDNIVVEKMARMSGDQRVAERLKDRPIYVAPASMPMDDMAQKRKKKKRKK